MAKELPYFRFTAFQWLNGDISLESYHLKGVFADVCAYYWFRDCDISLAKLEKKFSDAKPELKELLNLDIIKYDEARDRLEINFLDLQYKLLEKKNKKLSEAGRKGGLAKSSQAKARLRKNSSYKDKDKDKDKDKEVVVNSATTILKILNDLSKEKIEEKIELTQFSGNIDELKKKFSVEFVGRYGLNKKPEEVLELFQSWMYKEKNIKYYDNNRPNTTTGKDIIHTDKEETFQERL